MIYRYINKSQLTLFVLSVIDRVARKSLGGLMSWINMLWLIVLFTAIPIFENYGSKILEIEVQQEETYFFQQVPEFPKRRFLLN